jgi:hypothetical protein
MRAHLKDISARIVMSSESMVTCTSGLITRLKFYISNIRHGGTLSFRNFIMMVKNFKNHNFEALCSTLAYTWPKSGQSPKYDGILSIGNFILMTKNHILLTTTTKKCAPHFRGNTEFPIYFVTKYYCALKSIHKS